jgi:hypothetical protein
MKYGVGVAAASGALLTLWQLYPPAPGENPGRNYFVNYAAKGLFEMPPELMDDTEVYVTMGIICLPTLYEPEIVTIELPEVSPAPIQLITNPIDIHSFLPEPAKFEFPKLQVDPDKELSNGPRRRANHSK